MMYKPMRGRNGQLYYVFDEDAAEEILDFQDTAYNCLDTMVDALQELRDAIYNFPVPNIELFPEPEILPDPEEQLPPGELPF